MDRNLYMFALILLVMTLISSFGGAIRFEENFYNEVFDLLDDKNVEVVEGNDENDLASNSMEIQGTDENMSTEALVPESEFEEESKPESKPEFEPLAVEEEAVSEIEAYDAEQYASF